MTQYDKNFTFPVLFSKRLVSDTMGELLSKKGIMALKAAESEKFPHVTYFFNGGIEVTFKKELRTLAQSHKVKHDTKPKMRAEAITRNIINEVKKSAPGFILANYANPDMVGHTGNFNAVVEAVQTVDSELRKVTAFLTSHHYICLITADHGNADYMFDLYTHEPHTAHTLNPVPFIIYDPSDSKNNLLKLDQHPGNGLSKIAGTALELMGIEKRNMDFESLIK